MSKVQMKSTDCKKKTDKTVRGSHLSAVCECTKHVTFESSSSVQPQQSQGDEDFGCAAKILIRHLTGAKTNI